MKSNGHPVAQFRSQKRLSRRDLALVSEVNYRCVAEVELGFSLNLHPRLVDALSKMGYQGDPVTDHRAWRRAQGKEICNREGLANGHVGK